MVSSVGSFDVGKTSYSKVYDPSLKQLSLLDGTKKSIINVTLNSPLINFVGYGNDQKIAELTFVTSSKSISSILDSMKIINLDSGLVESKQVSYRVRSFKQVFVSEPFSNCSGNPLNTTYCVSGFNNFSYFTEEWIPLSNFSLKSSSSLTLGIFANVSAGESYEWIPTILGVEVPEWAVWTASLSSGLLSYYKLDEATGTSSNDFQGSNDLTLDNSALWKAGKLINSTGNDNGVYYWTNQTSNIDSGSPFTPYWTLSFWGKFVSNTSYQMILGSVASGTPSSCDFGFGTYNLATDDLMISWNGVNTAIQNKYSPTNTWHHYIFKYDSSKIWLYKNGVNIGNSSTLANCGLTNVSDKLFLFRQTTASGYARSHGAYIDEVGIWNRSLSESEISDLYNSGSALPFITDASPSLIVSYPSNYSNFTTTSLSLNLTVTDDQKVQNVTFYIDGVLNLTNTSNFNGTYSLSHIFSQGLHTWYALAYDNNSQSNQSSTYFFTIDSIPPTLSVHLPINTTYSSSNVSLKVTSDSASVWKYSINFTTNITFVPNSSYLFSDGFNNVTFWVNDSFGNVNSSIVYFTVDTTYPLLSVFSPINTTYTTTPISLLVWSDDASSWFYDLNSTGNISFTPNSSFVVNYTSSNNLTVWVNDSFNRWNSTTIYFSSNYTPTTTPSVLPGGGGATASLVKTVSSPKTPLFLGGGLSLLFILLYLKDKKRRSS